MSDLNEAELKALDHVINEARAGNLPQKFVRVKIKNIARDAQNLVDNAAKVAAVAAAVAAVTAAKILSLQMEIEHDGDGDDVGADRLSNITLDELISIRENALSRK
jgi:hypothetical protein